jgi:FkbM family methyltransferase
MRPARRAVGAIARRLERPELLAAFYPGARQALHEEIAIKAILASVLGRDETYVDIGSNRGQILREAVRVAPGGRHIAFEPIPSLAADLTRAFPEIDCRQVALAARPGTAEFCHFRSLDGWSGLRRSPQISDREGDPEYITVSVSTLDTELGDIAPAVIKIDVEGAELDVIEGGRSLLSRARPVLIVEHVAAAAQLYGAPSEALWEALDDLAYEIFSVTGDGPYTRGAFAEQSGVVNWLATPH